MKLKPSFKSIITILNPDPVVGGLEISEAAVRYVALNPDKSVARSVVQPLQSGVLVGGRVKDRAALETALRTVYAQIARGRERLPVILVISPASVYAQVFSLPPLPEGRAEEAARLNLRMISPIDFETAYADWQAISETEALGAFIEQKIADEYSAAAESAGFIVGAFEFAPLALARVVSAAEDLEAEEPYAVISAGGEGITFVIVREGNLYFTRFLEWGAFGEAPVPLSRFQAVVGSEMKRLLNFYVSKWGGAVRKALVVNTTSNKELAEWIKKEFSLDVFSIAGYHIMDRTWLIAVGAALRGFMPRREDKLISLARVGTEDLVVQNRVWRFVAVWRTVVFAVLGVSVAGFVAVAVALVHVERGVRAKARIEVGGGAGGNTATLETQARAFNNLVQKALTAQNNARPWVEILKGVYNDAEAFGVQITNLQFDSGRNIITVGGTAPHEQGVIAFKNSLADNAEIVSVDLPLSAITPSVGGRAGFTATIVVKN